MLSIKRLALSVSASLLFCGHLSYAEGQTAPVANPIAPGVKVVVFQSGYTADIAKQIAALNPSVQQIIVRMDIMNPNDDNSNYFADMNSLASALETNGLSHVQLGVVPNVMTQRKIDGVKKSNASYWGCSDTSAAMPSAVGQGAKFNGGQCVLANSINIVAQLNKYLKVKGRNLQVSIYAIEPSASFFLQSPESFTNIKSCLNNSSGCPATKFMPKDYEGGLKFGAILGWTDANTKLINPNAADYAYLEAYDVDFKIDNTTPNVPGWITSGENLPSKPWNVIDAQNKTVYKNTIPLKSNWYQNTIYNAGNVDCASQYLAFILAPKFFAAQQAGLSDRVFWMMSYEYQYLGQSSVTNPNTGDNYPTWTPQMLQKLYKEVAMKINQHDVTGGVSGSIHASEVQFGVWNPQTLIDQYPYGTLPYSGGKCSNYITGDNPP